jgi:putative tricarboxylic transport membrane protein
MMLCFGVVGYLMRKFGYEAAPLVLAFVLCPILEQSMRQSLMISRGSFMIFITRPISAIFLSLAGLSVLSYFFLNKQRGSVLAAADEL